MKRFLIMLLIILSFVSGCSLSPAYIVAGRVTGGHDKIVISLPELADRNDIIKISKETGESFGFNIIKIYGNDGNIEQGIVMKISSESPLKKFILPVGTDTNIAVYKPSQRLAENYKQKCPAELFDENTYRQHRAVLIYLEHSGLWGTGGKEEATKLLEQFKDKLLAKASAASK
jgi:hypothetical protein